LGPGFRYPVPGLRVCGDFIGPLLLKGARYKDQGERKEEGMNLKSL